MTYDTDGAGGSSSADAATVGSDHVLDQTQSIYDGDGNVIETIKSERLSGDSATAVGALGSVSGVGGPASRISYSGSYYDAANRDVADADAGTNGGVAWTRPSAVPASSSALLVTSYTYNSAGWMNETTDPRGIITKDDYDLLGRTTRTIADYIVVDGVAGTPTDSSNQTTAFAYDGDNNLISETAVMPSGETSETTDYIYGVSPATGSAISDNDLLYKTEYPNLTTGTASASQAETYSYDAAGDKLTFADRNGTTHAYSYDALDRMTADTVMMQIRGHHSFNHKMLLERVKGTLFVLQIRVMSP